jgi:hypothetical protein
MGPPEDVTTAVIEGWPADGLEVRIEPGQRMAEMDPALIDEGIADEMPPEFKWLRFTGRIDADGRAVFRLFHWRDVEPDEVVDLPLADDERRLLIEGLRQWGGPAYPTDEVARFIGVADVKTLFSGGNRICELLREGSALTKLDWQRALVATEVLWASQFYGAPGDWEAVSAWSDEQTLRTLRQLQQHFIGFGPARRPRKK